MEHALAAINSATKNVRVLQFRSPTPPADQILAYIAWVLTEASGIGAAIKRDGADTYKTQPFSPAVFAVMHADAETHWCRYDALLAQLGLGRPMMSMLVEGPQQRDAQGNVVGSGKGVFQLAPLNVEIGCRLELVTVDDLFERGYLAPPDPEPLPEPTPTPTPPSYSWPVVPPGYPAPPADAWVFLEATGPQLQARISALQALIPTRFTAGPYMDTYTSTPATGRMVPRWVVHVRDMTAREAVLWGAQHIRATAPAVDAEAGTAQWFE